MKKLLLAIALFSFPAFSAVTLDNWQQGNNNGGAGPTTWTHTSGCTVDCVGYVTASSLGVAAMTFTWNGSPMTLVTSHARTYGANGSGTLYIFCIVNPPNGAATIAGTSLGWVLGASVTLNGAKQTCTADAVQFTENTSGGCPFTGGVGYFCPAPITPVAANCWIIALFSATIALNGSTPTGTYRLSQLPYNDFFAFDSNGVVSGAYTLNAAQGSTPPNYSVIAVSVAPPASTYVANPSVFGIAVQ